MKRTPLEAPQVERVIANRCPACDKLVMGTELSRHRHPKPTQMKKAETPAQADERQLADFFASIKGVG